MEIFFKALFDIGAGYDASDPLGNSVFNDIGFRRPAHLNHPRILGGRIFRFRPHPRATAGPLSFHDRLSGKPNIPVILSGHIITGYHIINGGRRLLPVFRHFGFPGLAR